MWMITHFNGIFMCCVFYHNMNTKVLSFVDRKSVCRFYIYFPLQQMMDSICKAAESLVDALKAKADKLEHVDVKQ